MKQQGTQTISDENIRRFLLGKLRPAEQSQFERSLFTDDDLESRVRLAEVELSDDYVAGRLTRAERARFWDRFLLTADRKRKLAASKALHSRFAASSVRSRAGVFEPFGSRTYALRYAFAALILLLLIAGAFLITRGPRHIALPFIPKRISPKPSATATPQLTNHAENSAAPAHREPSPMLPLHEESTGVRLISNTPLESSPLIGASDKEVYFELILEQPLADSYDVDVTRTSGEPVFSTHAVKLTGDGTLALDLPAKVIESGDFQIVLKRVGGQSNASGIIYYFRVR